MDARALFVLDGPSHLPTESAVGPWDPDLLQGSASAAFLARALERADSPYPARLARLAFDLWRPVSRRPVTTRLAVLREGRKARSVEAALVQDEGVVARCTGLFLRLDPGVTPPGPEPLPLPPGPEAGRTIPAQVKAWSPFFTGVDTRVIEGDLLRTGPATAWFTLIRPLVEGEANSPLVQAVSAADLASGISAVVDIRVWTFVNADLTVTLWRAPVGPWILVRAATHVGDAGTGSTLAGLSDAQGPFGSCAQSLLFDRR
jgi:Acyl-CoA thioesterase C-terminal domain/Acyl-CoA thioesterase N-terminal domain